MLYYRKCQPLQFSCAGNVYTNITWKFNSSELPSGTSCIIIHVTGLVEKSANLQTNITFLQYYEFTATVSKIIAISIFFQWRVSSNKKNTRQLVQEKLSVK